MRAPALFWEIVRCPNLVGALLGTGDCAKVVRSMEETGSVPAPWVGGLETAPLLFVGPDPGFDRREVFPTAEWPDRAVEAYYFHRRDPGVPPHVEPPGVVRLDPRRIRAVAFWAELRVCAAELLDRPRAAVRAGVDYAVTEVVHCRSSDADGVTAAAPQCAKRYLQRLLAASAARVVVGFGATVRAQLSPRLGLPPHAVVHPELVGPIQAGGRARVFVFLPEPDPKTPCAPSQVLTPEGLSTLRRFLAGEDVRPAERPPLTLRASPAGTASGNGGSPGRRS